MKTNPYDLQEIKNLEAIYVVKGKAVFVTMSGKLVPPDERNRGWHWDVQMSPYQGDDKKEVLKKYYPSTRIVSDDSKKWGGERSLFRKAAEKLVSNMMEQNNQKPELIGSIAFHDRQVNVFRSYEDRKSLYAAWQVRNPDAFYTGPVTINWKTGETTYPEGVVPPTPTPEDGEMIPKFVIIEGYEYNENLQEEILEHLEKEHKRRNFNV